MQACILIYTQKQATPKIFRTRNSSSPKCDRIMQFRESPGIFSGTRCICRARAKGKPLQSFRSPSYYASAPLLISTFALFSLAPALSIKSALCSQPRSALSARRAQCDAQSRHKRMCAPVRSGCARGDLPVSSPHEMHSELFLNIVLVLCAEVFYQSYPIQMSHF